MIKFIIISLFPIFTMAAWTEVDRSELLSKNLLKDLNPGAENGKSKWAATGGTITLETSSTDIHTGNAALSWDASAASQFVASGAGSKKSGLNSTNGVGLCFVRTTATDYTMEIYDGTAVIASMLVPATSTYEIMPINFVFTNNTQYQIRFSSASDAAKIYYDDCFIGPASSVNLAKISQAEYFGGVIWTSTASCEWSRTSTSQGGFAADADCTTPAGSNILGKASAPATKIPAITFSSMPPGNYRIVATGAFAKNNTSAGASGWRFHDGTTGTSPQAVFTNGIIGYSPNIEGMFTYTTTQTNKTIEIQCAQATSGSCDILNSSSTFYELRIDVFYWPSSSQLSFNAAQSPASWSGYHGNNCSFARTNTVYGDPATDATCDLVQRQNTNFGTVTGANNLPSITFTPNKVGKYYVCANTNVRAATDVQNYAIKLTDGTTDIAESGLRGNGTDHSQTVPLCGIYNATSISSVTLKVQTRGTSGAITLGTFNADTTIEWSIFSLEQNFPAPLLINSVTSSYSGVARIEAGVVSCSATSSLGSQFGSWLSSVGNVSSGSCSITINSGQFSSTPFCWAIATDTTGSPVIISATATSSTAASIDCSDNAGTACTSYTVRFFCLGAK
jgi:hypothetical protein